MLHFALPIINTVFSLLVSKRKEIAREVGVSTELVDQIGDALRIQLTQDREALRKTAEEIEFARQHDIKTQVRDIWLVNLVRGLVRPGITIAAFCWYVYARVNGLELSEVDYGVIGGIMAFWFGIRSFDKKMK